ncbi:MAG: hypothetical protein H6Q78_1000 [Candidatus Krumholzibacteriota bacterium]|nr:hypothetical protein [Candidatus Krumholzibacteriota bacterium]
MFEHHSQPLLPHRRYLARLARHLGVASAILAASLGIGMLGYHGLERFSWVDSLLNASMILGGMGPVNELRTAGGKVFASFYSLFAGIVFLVAAAVLIAPAVHRLLHRLHMEEKPEEDEE